MLVSSEDSTELDATSWPVWLLRPVNKQEKLEVTTLMGIISPVSHQNLGLVLNNCGKEEYVWYLLKAPLVLGKLQQ